MDQFSRRTKYIDNYTLKYNLNEGEIAPQTYGIYWCMNATGINRIFSKELLHEFLFRLAITLDSMQLVENWFGWDRFLNFTVDDNHYSLNIEDVFQHFGFEAVDASKDMYPRKKYYTSIGRLIGNAQLTGHLLGRFQVIQPEKISEGEDGAEDTFQISFADRGIIVTEELIKKAEFFASDVIKNISQEQLKPTAAIVEKQKELEERREAIKNLPVFSLKKIPVDIQHECLHIFFNEKYANYLIEEAPPEKYREVAGKYIELSWLYANEYVWCVNDHEHGEREGVIFDPQYFEDETGGFIIPKTIEEYNIEDCEDLLKGLC